MLIKKGQSLKILTLSLVARLTNSNSNQLLSDLSRIYELKKLIELLIKEHTRVQHRPLDHHSLGRILSIVSGNPLLSNSVHDDEILEYISDPELIYQKYENAVATVIDGGYGNNEASTIINCTDNETNVIREGIGPIDII